jgi:hypothetical protein
VDAAFCNGCGSRLALSCAGCSRENPPDASFCAGCGQKLGGTAAPASAETANASTAAASAASPASPTAPASVSGLAFAKGRYGVQRMLGEGGKKRVYLAHDSSLGRDVAVSVLKTEGLDESGQVRVRHEAEAMGRLGDPSGPPHRVGLALVPAGAR